MSRIKDVTNIGVLDGTEFVPVDKAGSTIANNTTMSAIKAYVAADPQGTASAALVAHNAAYTHSNIHAPGSDNQDISAMTHTNRAALDLVSGTNTGDQDLSGYALTRLTDTVTGIHYKIIIQDGVIALEEMA